MSSLSPEEELPLSVAVLDFDEIPLVEADELDLAAFLTAVHEFLPSLVTEISLSCLLGLFS